MATSEDTKDAEFFNQLEGLNTEGKDWCAAYSLRSLRLTLEDILNHAKIERRNVLVEFPFFHYLKALNKIEELPQSPSRPQPQLNQTKLAQKKKELKLLVRFYENRIHWLCHSSRQYFGLIRGNHVALIVESSDELFSLGSGVFMREYTLALTKLVEDQLENKEIVYCIQYGSSPTNSNPQGFPFSRFSKHCVQQVKEWVNGLKKAGTNNIYSALKMALAINNLDTIVVVTTTLPDQPLDIIHHYMVDKLTGDKHPKLHLVAFRASSEVQTSFRELAKESHGHYHGYSPDPPSKNISPKKPPNVHKTVVDEDILEIREKQLALVGELVEDSDVNSVKEEISKARKILIDIESVKCGLLDHALLEQLRELSVSIDWEEDDNFSWQAAPTETIFKLCSTDEWAKKFGLNSHGLNLYSFLAPDAYPQLREYVNSTNSTVVSQVYDVMPLLPWKDGSMKYIHVDVHRLDQYISTLDTFIVDHMLERLGWQLSGCHVPFGLVVEGRILVLLDSSCAVMGEILGLQQHLRMLIKEQLAYTHDFNLISYGKKCRLWTSGFAEPHRQSLLQAWEWVLGMSPAGSADLLAAMKMIFESNKILDDKSEEEYDNTVGIYLVATALPDQSTDILCSYLEQVLSGLNVRFHVIFYDTEPLQGPQAFQLGGGTGGRCGLEEDVEVCLRALAKVGRGTFHHFRVSGSCEGEELTKMVGQIDTALGYATIAKELLQNYRQFCKKHISPTAGIPQKLTSCQSPLPIYPRQTTTSLARMNCCLSQKEETERKREQSQKLILNGRKNLYSVKNYSWYTGRGLDKVNTSEVVRTSTSKKLKKDYLIPVQEELMSSKKWVSIYGLDALGLTFDYLTGRNSGGFRSQPTFKHYNSQGEVVELQVNSQELKGFRHKMKTAMARYCRRLQWLTQDYRQYLGVVCEKEVVLLIDMSSSMSSHLPQIKDAIILLLNNMPPKIKRFNVIAYSNQVEQWCPDLQFIGKRGSHTGHNLESAIQWTEKLQANGSSYLLEAIKVCIESKAQGVYIVTDGTTDHTHDFLLQQLPWLQSTYKTEWSINTVAWQSSTKSASFLRELAHRTGGRYHSFPDFSAADDYTIMRKEILRTERELKRVNDFK